MAGAFEICRLEDARAIRLAPGGEALLDADAIWVLDGIGLAATHGLKLDEQSDSLVRERGNRLSATGGERVFRMVEQILLGDFAGQAVLAYADVLAAAIPVLGEMNGCPQHSPYHIYDVLTHTAHVIDASPATPLSRWAALFHDAGKPRCRWTDKTGRDHFTGHAALSAQIASDVLAQLDAPPHLRDDVCLLVRKHEWFTSADDEGLRRALAEFGGRTDLYRALLGLQVADSSAKAPAAAHRLEHARETQERFEAALFNASAHKHL